MLSRCPIRVKLWVGLSLLVLLVAILSSTGLYTNYAYRNLVKSLSWRVIELPMAGQLSHRVSDLRMTLSELRGLRAIAFPHNERNGLPFRLTTTRNQFQTQLEDVEETLSQYRTRLESKWRADLPMADNQGEWETVHKIEAALRRVHDANRDESWMLDDAKVDRLDNELEHLQTLTTELPGYLYARLAGFATEVRGQYRTLIYGLWITSISAALVFALFVRLFYRWIFLPLRVLVNGSRQVAGGQFNYRIHLETQDEMSELAEALNDMTARFQAIRDDLDRQVQERTKQVVRSEQLASVGFLAAGVAHEINNPLASIAMCAESLEGRVRELLDRTPPQPPDPDQVAVVSNYLRMIQDEAFRCKEITEKLLDFSRIGPSKRQQVDLGELVQGVIDMVGHLGKYQGKQIELVPTQPVAASVNPQEIKQVVLNLLTNALDSLDEGGAVRIEVRRRDRTAEMVFADNGCGIEPDVLERIFEPFFTRRKAGQGTGLGLSIAYRIVADHGGEIEAHSPGIGQGATFRVRLPLFQYQAQAA